MMKRKSTSRVALLVIVFLLLSLFPSVRVKAAVNLSGTLSGLQDYSGQDVTIGNVTVAAYNGSSGGWLEVRGNNITVTGTINATGAGYGGGGGGGGGATNSDAGQGSLATGGAGGAGQFGGSNGTNGTKFGGEGMGVGGAGGRGGGSYGGAGGSGGPSSAYPNASSGGSGSIGGYSGNRVNGDSSTDESVFLGSGGGGGGGASSGRSDTDSCGNNVGGGGGGAGGAGNKGGGYVKLIATGTLTITGAINTKGLSGMTGNGGNGIQGQRSYSGAGGTGGNAGSSGSSSGGTGGARSSDCRGNFSGGECSCRGGGGGTTAGGTGGTGGAGAGGGVLLKGKAVSVSGSIDTRGGGNNTTNGGTLKVFYTCSYAPGSNYTGRTYSTIFGVCNNPPTVTIETPNADGLESAIGTTISFQARATDSDGTIASHSWYMDTGGCAGAKTAEKSNTGLNTSNSTSSLDYAFSPPADTTHTVYYQSQDNSGSLSACVSRTVQIKKAPCGESCLGPTQCPGDGLTGEAGKTWTYVDNSSLCSSAECECYHEPEPGACGSAQDETFCAPPTDDPKGSMCSSSVDPTGIKEDTDSNRWTWTCPGPHGGTPTTCYAAKNCAWQEVGLE